MPPINTYESQIDAFCDVLLSQAQDVDAQLSIISSIQEAVAAIPLLAQAYAQLLLLCPLSNPVPPATACILPAEAASVPPVGTLPVCP